MVKHVILFLALNFAGLALGGLFTEVGAESWYGQLNKAPWTPPGWVFGAAWTVIMVCFAFYMAYAYKVAENKSKLMGLFIIQWVLNFAWNPLFFKLHASLIALIVITTLAFLISYFLLNGFRTIKYKAILILPYFIWIWIATSLNAYTLLNN